MEVGTLRARYSVDVLEIPAGMDDQEVLGDSLIPIINRLQDIFSQVRLVQGAADDLGPLLWPYEREASATVDAHSARYALDLTRLALALSLHAARRRGRGATPQRCTRARRPGSAAARAAQVTLDFKLALPQVAVVGSQSSGKSSVLEALVRGRRGMPPCRSAADSCKQRLLRCEGCGCRAPAPA